MRILSDLLGYPGPEASAAAGLSVLCFLLVFFCFAQSGVLWRRCFVAAGLRALYIGVFLCLGTVGGVIQKLRHVHPTRSTSAENALAPSCFFHFFLLAGELVNVTWSCKFIIGRWKVKICTRFSNWGDALCASETCKTSWCMIGKAISAPSCFFQQRTVRYTTI